MKLLTLMDFPYDENTMTVLKSWVYLAKRYNPSAQLIILYANFLTQRSMDELKEWDSQIQFVKLPDTDNYLQAKDTKGHVHPFQSTLFARYDIVHKMGLGKHLFLDWDALVLSPLDDVYALLDEKPVITIPERRQTEHELLTRVGINERDPNWGYAHKIFPNIGFILYDTRSNMLTVEAMMDQYRRDGRILFPISEQGLIAQMFFTQNYDWEHEKVDYSYNCSPLLSRVKRIDDSEIDIRSGIFVGTLPPKYDWLETWVGWRQSRRIKVIHPFGLAKYWENPHCREFWAYCKDKVG